MSTAFFSPFPSDAITIPGDNEEQSYKDIIKQLAAQAPEPYGAIPPLLKKKKKRNSKRKLPIRRMSHVENWVAVDSKESIPDEQDLRHSSPFRNFLSTDFLVLPLHMPPPSLSATAEAPLLPIIEKKKLSSGACESDFRPVLFPLKKTIPIHNDDEDEDEEDEEYEEEDEDEEEETEDDDDDDDDNKSISSKRSIPSFSKSQTPSTSTTRSYAMSSSPPKEEQTRSRWLETIAQLKKSLTRSTLGGEEKKKKNQVIVKKEIVFIPMPLPPKRNIRKRRSEATTQPRFNPETNTYTRDTRSNPDHLRMISAELNMMRSRKLSSPLKPRGFLPRRTDSFIRGDKRRLSSLCKQV
ncbi:hypothetical protein HPULCUR_010066 [Helicostylum pulchrum]|uniref:Uncharacterized protein n=1 Tax=Helicostylum pulchrum TaxID=562976 RepID=A0ABP9YC77_9FUNG